MEMLVNLILPVILYVVAIILLSILIVVCVKVIKLLNKVDKIVDNIDEKVNTFNGILGVLKRFSDGVSVISDSLIFNISTLISKMFDKFKKNDKEEDYE